MQERKERIKDKWLSNILLILLFPSSLHLLLQVSDAAAEVLIDTSSRYL
jgi:hypothetical protein